MGRFGRIVAGDIALHVAIAVAASVALYVSIDSVEAVNRALSRATLFDLSKVELFNVPAIVQQFAMMCVLIGTLTAVASLVRRGEAVAIFAAGGRPQLILRPAILTGLLLALAYAALTEWVAPVARAEVSAARRRLGLPAPPTDVLSTSRAWFRGADLVYRVKGMDEAGGGVLSDVLMLKLSSGRLSDRWDVGELRYEGGRWIGRDVLHRRFVEAEAISTEHVDQQEMALEEVPEDFVTSIGAPDRLEYARLDAAMHARERLGQPAIAHRLELYRRHAHPLALLGAVVLSAAVALRLGRRPSIARSLGAGVLLGFGLWVTDELSLALGTSAALSPIVAAHVPLAVVLAAAGFAWLRVHREGLRT
jgi:LPS export ABC transporter permease LptG